jgi:hypothetical protein
MTSRASSVLGSEAQGGRDDLHADEERRIVPGGREADGSLSYALPDMAPNGEGGVDGGEDILVDETVIVRTETMGLADMFSLGHRQSRSAGGRSSRTRGASRPGRGARP